MSLKVYIKKKNKVLIFGFLFLRNQKKNPISENGCLISQGWAMLTKDELKHASHFKCTHMTNTATCETLVVALCVLYFLF